MQQCRSNGVSGLTHRPPGRWEGCRDDRDTERRDSLYRQTNAAFLKAASDFRFTFCNYYWTVDDVPERSR